MRCRGVFRAPPCSLPFLTRSDHPPDAVTSRSTSVTIRQLLRDDLQTNDSESLDRKQYPETIVALSLRLSSDATLVVSALTRKSLSSAFPTNPLRRRESTHASRPRGNLSAVI